MPCRLQAGLVARYIGLGRVDTRTGLLRILDTAGTLSGKIGVAIEICMRKGIGCTGRGERCAGLIDHGLLLGAARRYVVDGSPGHRHVRFGRCHSSGIVAVVNLGQQLPLAHDLVVLDSEPADLSCNTRRNNREIRTDEGIIGRLSRRGPDMGGQRHTRTKHQDGNGYRNVQLPFLHGFRHGKANL